MTTTSYLQRRLVLWRIVEKINPNAHWLKQPSHLRTTNVFNVNHLIPYVGDLSLGDDDAANSRMNFLYPGGNDVEQEGIEYLEA